MLESNPHPFDSRKSSAAFAHDPGDGSRDAELIGGEIDVERDQNIPRADRRGAGRGMELRPSEVWQPVDLRHPPFEAFEAAAPYVCKIAASGSACGLFVQINRYLKSRRHHFCCAA